MKSQISHRVFNTFLLSYVPNEKKHQTHPKLKDN